MNLREQIDSHEYLYLWETGEPETNVLRVVVDEAKASDDSDVEIPKTPFMGRPIISDETCRRYEITFPSYAAYAVLNESFAKVDEYEQYTGRYFRVCSKSHFLATEAWRHSHRMITLANPRTMRSLAWIISSR
jgi:hypothetical protein